MSEQDILAPIPVEMPKPLLEQLLELVQRSVIVGNPPPEQDWTYVGAAVRTYGAYEEEDKRRVRGKFLAVIWLRTYPGKTRGNDQAVATLIGLTSKEAEQVLGNRHAREMITYQKHRITLTLLNLEDRYTEPFHDRIKALQRLVR